MDATTRQPVELADVRRMAGQSQVALAEVLGIGQASVARLEQRGDPRVSTLRRFVEALGGELDIIVRIGDSEVCIRDVGVPDVGGS